jgi:general secretion pathway protein C
MTLTPVGLFWPRPSLLLFHACLGLGAAAWVAHRTPAVAAVAAPPAPTPPLLSTVSAPTPPLLSTVSAPTLGPRRFHYRVLRAALLREAKAEPSAASCRIVPAIRDSMPAGFRVYAIRPNSLYARLGLRNGDLVERINGALLTTPDRALEIYARLREARWIRVDLERRGVPMQMVYEIVD